MTQISFTELLRLTPPFKNQEDEREAFMYWKKRSPEEKFTGSIRLTRAFHAWLGNAANAPINKAILVRHSSFDLENQESEELSRRYVEWKAHQ